MMASVKIIKAPAVDDLNDLKKIIKSLEYSTIPYSYIDERRLQELQNEKKLSKKNHEKINDWKISEGISCTKGNLQSMVSLLKSLGIIASIKLDEKNLEQPLGFSGPMLSSFISKSVDAVKLTKIGYTLCYLLHSENNSISEYDDLLFWRFLHSNIIHNFQKLIEDSNSYTKGIDVVLKNIEMDSRTVNYFLKWSSYFELLGIDSKLLIKKKVVKKIIFSTIFELNQLKPGIYSIQKLTRIISKELDFSSKLINFFLIFEIILQHIQLSKENEKEVEGTYSSRDELSLPNFPKVNMLKIHPPIRFNSLVKNVSESELNAVINREVS
ncbi:MAG: hypothetical protein J4F36_07175 [Nitrosopumilaceae archaeon]|nr:hypothetical protein [Nitrosopumilaceae archaeon]